MKNQYFAYVRVSTVKQGEGVSLEAQQEAIERYANQHNLTVTSWFEEKETAAKQGRPIFTDMVKALKAGKAQGLIMHKIDRSARNLRDWATVNDLQDSGISVHFAAESVDFASRGGRLTADIQAVIAADYIRNLKEEVRKGQLGRLKQGLYPFFAPFGYRNMGPQEPKAIDPKNGPLVREMFELYASGEYSLSSLEAEMYRRGMRSVSGRKVYKSKIDNILKNPFYMGIIRLRAFDTPFEGIHEPIVSAELFRRAQAVRKNKSRKKKTKHDFLFRGVFSCSECGNQFSPEKQRGHVYYRCHTKSCAGGCVREDAMQSIIEAKLRNLEMTEETFEQLEGALRVTMKQLPEQTDANTTSLKLAQIDAQLERLTQGFVEGLIPEHTFREKKIDCDFRKLELSKSMQNQSSPLEKDARVREFFEHVKTLCQTYLWATDSEKRQILRLAFSNISIAGKQLDLEPKDWLRTNLKAGFVRLGGDYEYSLRSLADLKEPEFSEVLDYLDCPEVEHFCQLLTAIRQNATKAGLPETPNAATYRIAA